MFKALGLIRIWLELLNELEIPTEGFLSVRNTEIWELTIILLTGKARNSLPPQKHREYTSQ